MGALTLVFLLTLMVFHASGFGNPLKDSQESKDSQKSKDSQMSKDSQASPDSQGSQDNQVSGSTCNPAKLPVLKKFDPNSMKGTWYPVYYSHIPESLKTAANIRENVYSVKTEKQADGTDGTVIRTDITTAYKDGTCNVHKCILDGGQDPRSGVFKERTNNQQKITLFILGVHIDKVPEKSMIACYYQVKVDGKVSRELSYVFVMVQKDGIRRPSFKPIAKGLKAFCGKSAMKPNFFQRLRVNNDIRCPKTDIYKGMRNIYIGTMNVNSMYVKLLQK